MWDGDSGFPRQAQLSDFLVQQVDAPCHALDQAVSDARVALHQAEELFLGITITVQGSLATTVALRFSQ